MNFKHIIHAIALTSLISSSVCAQIILQAAPSSYAKTWHAYDAHGYRIDEGNFTIDKNSGSTGYRFAHVTNDATRITIQCEWVVYTPGKEPKVVTLPEKEIVDVTPDATYTITTTIEKK